MDIGSNPLGISKGGTSGSSDSSLNGLKFGKKIYFEDVGIGVSTKSGSGSSSILIPEGIPLVSQTPGPARKGRGVVQGGQPPRCQVEGCDVDLSGAKSYYSRHKVCSMHSKSPKVIVAGLEQRFCQQCSRFHQLPEFDQGKRSCRRRLAGHNERRRKPQPGSLLSPRIGRLSSLQEDSGRVSGFVMDFSAYPRTSEREVWPTIRAQGDQPTATGKFLAQQWQGIPVSHQANVYSHGSHPYMRGSSAGENILSSSRTPPPSECFAGVNDSGCALSLLSNQSQSWGLKNQSSSSLPMNNLMNNEGTPMAQSTTSHAVVMNNNFTGHSWSFKSDEAGTSSNGLHHDLGLVQVSSHAINVCEFSDGLEFGHQQTNRQYTDLAHSRAYDSSSTTHEMNWSL